MVGLDTAFSNGCWLGMMGTDTVNIRGAIDAAESGRSWTFDSVLYVSVLITEFLLLEKLSKGGGF